MRYSHVMKLCAQALSEFQSEREGVEQYIHRFLKSFQALGLKEEEKVFVTEVFAGCVRYSDIFYIVLENFFQHKEKTSDWANFHLYLVLLYLITLRFDEVKVSVLQKLLKNQKVHEIHRFLNFFLNDENLNTWIKDKWCHFYDVEFVEKKLLEPLRKNKPDLDEFLLKLEEKINQLKKKKLYKKPTTESKPFDLTKIKPVFVSIPDKTENASKQKRYSLSYFKNEPKEFSILREIKAENRRKADMEQLEANEKQFSCSNHELSSKTKLKMQRIKDSQDGFLRFDMKHRSQIPKNKSTKPIKTTSAAIFREADLYRRQRREEAKKYDALACGDLDVQWPEAEDEKEREELLAKVHQRRIQGKINREGAMLARQMKTKRNKELVRHYRKAKDIVFEEHKKLQELEKDEKKMLIKQLNGIHQKVLAAKRKTQKENRKVAQNVNAITNDQLKKSRSYEVQLTLKKAVSHRKHPLERFPKNRKVFDSTSVPDHCAMFGVSLAETREKLSRLREVQQTEIEEKRDSITKAKVQKTESLVAAASFASAHRSAVSKMVKKRDEEKQFKQKLLEDKLRDDSKLNDLREKLKEMTEQRMKLSAELAFDVPRNDASFTEKLIRISKEKERSRYKQVEENLEREARRAKVPLY